MGKTDEATVWPKNLTQVNLTNKYYDQRILDIEAALAQLKRSSK